MRRKIKTRQTGRREAVSAILAAKPESLHGGGETKPIKERNRVGDRRRRHETAGRATTGRNSKQKEESSRVCMHVTRSHTHALANSICRPPPAPSSLLIKYPLCWLDATASNCVAAASRSRPPPPSRPLLSPSPAPTSSHPRHPRHVTSPRYTSIKLHQAHN